jgi:pSer/pThr/pTyr-binding forkhead associated (FHA) protein
MQLILEVVGGPSEGKRATVQAGQPLSVGRTDKAQLVIPNDPWLSGPHFTIEPAGESWVLRDLKSNQGTKLEGVKISEAELFDGDEIRAGDSRFRVKIPGGKKRPTPPSPAGQAAPAAPPKPVATAAAVAATAAVAAAAGMQALPPGDTVKERVLNYLRQQKEPLFALLDAARNDHIAFLVYDSGEEFQSLYEGEKGEELAFVAPYLVRLPPQSKFLEVLVDMGWGDSWGIYLTCGQPFVEVRKHFRRFLTVETEEKKTAYFRFYDPRVLRVYLPTCTPTETKEFFGPTSVFICEGRPADRLLLFSSTQKTLVPLALELQSVE